MNSLINKKILLAYFILLGSLFFAETAFAATLYTKPSQTQVSAGNIISIQVLVNTADQVINNAESIIQYPPDLLEIISLDKTSIFSLWVQEPSYSNNTGQLTFNGGVPNPGFQGNNGKIISITFRAKRTGTASIVFLGSAVRANDGLGTDILTSKTGSEITIVGEETNNVQTPTKLAINLTSSSHPNQNNWYNRNDVELLWIVPKGAQAVKTLLGSYPNSEPSVYYSNPITSKSIKKLDDGVWYFHANYLKDGTWSEPEHYRLQIDTVNPTDLTAEAQKDDSGNMVIHIKASDSLSGVDHFKVIPDSEDSINIKANQNGEASAEVPFSTAGQHTITIVAYDKAGNSAETKVNAVISTASELNIDSYLARIKVNESIEASGSAPYPYAQIRISLKDNDGIVTTYKVKSDSYSKFNFISQPITKEGKYTLFAEIINSDGEVKYSSDNLSIIAEEPLLLQIGSYTIELMKVLIPALALIIVFSLMFLYGWLKFFSLYRRVKKEKTEAEKIIEKSFNLLKKDLNNHISKLKRVQSKRKLTDEESNFLEEFGEELTEAEEIINKEVKDIPNT